MSTLNIDNIYKMEGCKLNTEKLIMNVDNDKGSKIISGNKKTWHDMSPCYPCCLSFTTWLISQRKIIRTKINC